MTATSPRGLHERQYERRLRPAGLIKPTKTCKSSVEEQNRQCSLKRKGVLTKKRANMLLNWMPIISTFVLPLLPSSSVLKSKPVLGLCQGSWCWLLAELFHSHPFHSSRPPSHLAAFIAPSNMLPCLRSLVPLPPSSLVNPPASILSTPPPELAIVVAGVDTVAVGESPAFAQINR